MMARLIAALFIAASICFAKAQVGPLPGSGPFLSATSPVIGTPQGFGTIHDALNTTENINNTAAILSGDLLLACVEFSGASVSSISDGTNSYTQLNLQTYRTAATYQLAIWYKFGATALASGTTTITFSPSSTQMVANLMRVPGLQNVAFDTNSTSNGTTLTASAATGTLAKANELIVGCAASAGTGGTYGYSGATGFTNVSAEKWTSGGGPATGLDYQKVSSTSSVTYSPVFTGGTGTIGTGANVASFKGF